MTSYQKSLSNDAIVEGEGYGAKFSLSTGYTSVEKGTNGDQKVYVESIAKCTQYQASFKSGFSVSII